MAVIHAKRIDFETKVHLITTAVSVPKIEKSREYCASYNSHSSEGAFCYRVCGKLPKGKHPITYKYFSQMVRQGEHVDWEECSHDGCEGYDHHFDEDTSTVCSTFKLWKGQGGHGRLMMEIAVI
jgi:hypothetical protein